MRARPKTTNPLPFQDLEPRRFEDLVGLLAYDFKVWRKLEPSGRSGSDGGFDLRGYEIVPSAELLTPDDDEEERDAGQTDRLWLVQCKRESAVAPKKLRDYLDEIPIETRRSL